VWLPAIWKTSGSLGGRLAVGLTIGFGVCLMLVAATLWTLARQRRQIATLMARLDAVEGVPAGRESEAAEPRPRHRDPPSPEDVLHGRTTYVQAMIEGSDSGSRSLADRTILAVHSNLEETITPRRLAADLNVSLRTLERVLAATLECSPRQLIVTVKMREARRLLLDGELRVSEVAYRLGFSSPAHFSTRFKAFYGCSPSAFLRDGSVGRSSALDGEPSRVVQSGDDG
jgi:AraC-like DNA-binding protein